MPGADRSVLFNVRPATSNVGNDVIALATEGLIAAAWPGPVDVVSLPSAGAGRGGKAAGLTARNVYEANLLADAVLAGGGNVFENGALDVEPTALEALAPPLGLLAASHGRVRGRDGRLRARTDSMPRSRIVAVCHRAEPLLVRDDATAEFLAGLGLEHAAVGGCPSVLLDRYVALPAPDESLAGTALLSIRHPRLMSIPYLDQGRVHADVCGLHGRLVAEYGHAELLCHDFQDLAFAATVPGAVARYTEDPLELLRWIRSCAIQVGYRLHGFLAAVALGTEAVHVSYDERGESMIATLGLEAHDVSLLRSGDVPAAVLDRVRSLGGRPPRLDAESARDRFDEVLVAGVRRLAARADAARATREPVL